MSLNQKKWPGVGMPEDDRDLMTRIRQQEGVLKNIEQKDLLMIAASLAVKSDAPTVPASTERRVDTISPGNMNQYGEFRQYIALIYFKTAGHQDLNSMDDPKLMVDNFVDYARRGLQLLKVNYLEAPDGDAKINEMFVDYLSKVGK